MGGRAYAYRDGTTLRNFLFDTGGVDLGFSGCKYTWQNKRSSGQLVRERIDRVIVDTGWMSICPSGGVRNLPILCSDHGAILFNSHVFNQRGSRPFRFFEAWFSDPSSLEVIKEAWEVTTVSMENSGLIRKLSNTQNALRRWSKNVFGDTELRLKHLEFKLQSLQSREDYELDLEEEKRVQRAILDLWDRKESIWKQDLGRCG
ncbi:uncharacterized protein LOC133033880 [Cannabis sativa]|uniref:uncharacterized protein LOC133033880 n=1 Tax=Cannabis sativa TaxID=3483 RepID=UPI0029CA1AAD|nr:uncharacterized protein LOC133033880 [Cannabis sativa]